MPPRPRTLLLSKRDLQVRDALVLARPETAAWERALADLPPLPKAFFERGTVTVARDLLGKALVRTTDEGVAAGVVVEVEVYHGNGKDPAAHSHRGETPRNASMFRGGGTCYVYLSYGINHCMNVVTGAVGLGDGVLLRALAPIAGTQLMAERRGVTLDESFATWRSLTSGPGKLTRALGIDLVDNGGHYRLPGLKLVDLGIALGPRDVIATPRIGISQAKDRLLRFTVKDSPWTSR
jgi:DNA-3-methyladenine glycosylase